MTFVSFENCFVLLPHCLKQMNSCTPRNEENLSRDEGQEREAFTWVPCADGLDMQRFFIMFKIICSWASAFKSGIKQPWIASSALEDLPEGLQGEAGRRQKDIPWLLHWFWNQTSMPKPEWMQQHYFMSHIPGLLLLCILRVWAFYPRNKWWQCSPFIQG